MDTNKKKLVLSIENLYFNIKINKDIVNNKLRQIYDTIKNTMSHIHSCYEKSIITKSYYNTNIDELESIFDMYKFIMNESKNIRLYNYKIVKINKSISVLDDNLNSLIQKTGYNNILSYIEYLLDINIIDEYPAHKNILSFYNSFFIPESFKYDIQSRHIKNIKIVLKKRPKSSNITLIEKLEGAILIYYFKSYKITLNGIFKKDPLNSIRFNGYFEEKYTNIIQQIQLVNTTCDFKNKYLDQISLRDFVVLPENEILYMIENGYNDLLLYRHKPLSSLIKEFMNSDIEKQRYILTLFVISNSDDQFLAHVIYDILENNDDKYSNQYDHIYSSMHRSVQKLFKSVILDAEKNKIMYNTLTESDIPYEKRIHLMKTTEGVKKKAFDKLKDIKGSKENAVKAHQFLDGILQIPFSIYKKEAILSFIENYVGILDTKLKYIKSTSSNINVQPNQNIDILDVIKPLLINTSLLKTDQSINIYIKSAAYILNKLGEYIKLHSNTTIRRLYKQDIVKILNIIDIKNISFIISTNNSVDNDSIDSDSTDDDSIDGNDIGNSIDDDGSMESNNNSIDSSINNQYNNTSPIISYTNESLLLDSSLIDEEQDFKLNELLTSTNIPQLDKINEYMDKIKNIQHLKNILIDNDKLTSNTIELMNSKINEITSDIGVSDILETKYSNKNVDNINYSDIKQDKSEVKTNDILHLVEIYYNIIYDFIYKWLEYKKAKINYINNVNSILDNCIYGHINAKKQISRLIGQWMNGKMTGGCIGFCGPPGVGKTTLCKNGLSKCLINEDGSSRPFAFVPLGGSSNGPLLEGHHYTYLGSTWGKIVDILITTKCMNPIIYLDEVDKISKTEQGKEIISILTHITDPSQNMEFNDRYFAGVPIDLSKVLFIFSYNDSGALDHILKDRIHEIQIKGLTRNEKIKITKDYILPEILDIVGFTEDNIILKRNEIEYLIDNYTYEAGVRKLHEHLLVIIREINLQLILDNVTLPFTITTDYIKDVFDDKQIIKVKKIADKPYIGLVNGLYATSASIGGLTIIEVLKTPSTQDYSLHLTGQQGDVMKESMHCAKTLAWNLLPNSVKKTIKTDWDKNGHWGLHIHCPEGATPKDGPSAGCAITIAILSRMCGIPVRNDMALTGEIDLNGNVCEVGGISSKIDGAIKAGVSTIFIPKDNETDYDKYAERQNESMSSSSESLDSMENNDIKIVLVSRIEEILDEIFVKKIKYNKIQ